MRKSILFLATFLLMSTIWSQTGRFTTVKLKNPTERTDFSNGYEWLPLMRTNGRINSYIHTDSLALKSQINALNLQQVTDQGNTTTNSIKVGSPSSFESTIDASSFGTLNSINNERSAYGTNFMQFTNAASPTNAFIISMPGATDMNAGFRSVNFRYLSGTVAYLNDIPTLQAGSNITIDNTDPLSPIINATGGGTGISNTYSNGLTLTGSDVEIGGLLNSGITNISITDPTTLFVIGGDVSNPVVNPTNVTVGQNQLQLNSSTTLSLNAPSGINVNNSSSFDGVINVDDFIDFSNGSTSTKLRFEGSSFISSSASNPLQIWGGNSDVLLQQATFNLGNSIITRGYYESNMPFANFPTLGNFFVRHNTSQGNFLPTGSLTNLGNGAMLMASYDDSGSSINANGDYSVVMGRETRTNALSSMIVGAYNSTFNGSNSTYVETDPAFVVGIGENDSTRKDGIVVKKNGVILAPELTTAEIDARILNTIEDKTLIHIEYLKERFGLTNPGFDPNVLFFNKQVWANQFRISSSTPPSSSNDTGLQGQIAWDADYIYICVTTNTWKRVSISTW